MRVAGYVEHLAGEYVEGVQACLRCGEVIVDDRGASWVSSDADGLPAEPPRGRYRTPARCTAGRVP